MLNYPTNNMKKRTAILILILTIALGSAVLYFLLGGRGPNGLPVIPGLPFGNAPEDTLPGDGTGSTDGGGTGTTTDSGEPTGSTGVPLSSFVRLSDTPVAGAVVIEKGGVPLVRFVERATGHVFESNLKTGGKAKIINTTRPQIYKALWRGDGTGFVESTVLSNSDSVVNTSISLEAPISTSTDALYTMESTLLEGEVGEMAMLPNGALVYTLNDVGGVYTSGFSGERPRSILATSFKSWLIQPLTNTSAILSTKPSFKAEGYVYTLNLNSGNLTKILGPLMGLTAISNSDGKRLIYSNTTGGRTLLTARNLVTDTATNILPATLPEKCVWSKKVVSIIFCGVPDAGLGLEVPDLWYQGVSDYTDKIWRFNVDTDTAEIILDPKAEFGQEVDMTNLVLDTKEEYLIFTNKKDLTLWAFKLD